VANTQTALGWNNYVKTATLVASSAATNLPVSNLQDDVGSPAVAWQTLAGATSGVTLTITPPTGQQKWRCGGLFGCNLTPGATVSVALFNNPSTGVASLSALGPVVGYRQTLVVFSQDFTADYMKITITDAGNPDGFLNIPLVFAGPLWLPQLPPDFKSTFGRNDGIDEVISKGGQEYPVMRWQQRKITPVFSSIVSAEVWPDVDALDMQARTGTNVLMIPDINSANVFKETVYGRLKTTADISYPYQGADRRSWTAAITERL
jgi:hypothetical protein